MTTQIPFRDWEALSAYLDNQLNTKDRIHLETRLERDPGLQEALRELKNTRWMLKHAPRLRSPRNFT